MEESFCGADVGETFKEFIELDDVVPVDEVEEFPVCSWITVFLSK